MLALAECLLGFLLPTLALAAWEAGLYRRYCQYWLAWQRAEVQQRRQQFAGAGQGGAAPSPSSGAAGSVVAPNGGWLSWCPTGLPVLPVELPDPLLCPFLSPPSRAAATCYRALLACRPSELLDCVALSATAVLLLAAMWHALLLLGGVD